MIMKDENDEKNNVPVPPPAEADGTGDAELLKAISSHPECAHVLAAIAAGGDPDELIATLVPKPAEDDAPAAPEPAMYQSATVCAPSTEYDEPWFADTAREDFWDFF
jgi:hypothetical protein